MEVLSDRVHKRQRIFDYYRQGLSNHEGVAFLEGPLHLNSNRWLSCISFNQIERRVDPHRVMEKMAEKNIEVRRVWKPMHMQPVFTDYPAYISGVSEAIFDTGLCLPSSSSLTEMEQDRVMEELIKNM